MIGFILFLFIILVYVIYSYIEARNYLDLGKYYKKGWVYQSMEYSEYHKILWYVFFPFIFIFFPIFYFLITKNLYQAFKLLFISGAGYFLGGIVEDRLWFFWTKNNFSPKIAVWFKWINFKIRKVKITLPLFYIKHFIISVVLLIMYLTF